MMKLITKTLMAVSGVAAIGTAAWIVATRKSKTKTIEMNQTNASYDDNLSDNDEHQTDSMNPQ